MENFYLKLSRLSDIDIVNLKSMCEVYDSDIETELKNFIKARGGNTVLLHSVIHSLLTQLCDVNIDTDKSEIAVQILSDFENYFIANENLN